MFRCSYTLWALYLPTHQLIDIWSVFTFWLSWILLCKFWGRYNFSIFLEYISRSGIAKSHVNSMFNCLRNRQTVYESRCTILGFHYQGASVPLLHIIISTFYCFFHCRYPGRCERQLIMILICILRIFSCLLNFPKSSLLSVQILCPHINWVICLFHWVAFLCTSFTSYMIFRHFFPICGLSFHWWCHLQHKCFSFWSESYLVTCIFGVVSKTPWSI